MSSQDIIVKCYYRSLPEQANTARYSFHEEMRGWLRYYRRKTAAPLLFGIYRTPGHAHVEQHYFIISAHRLRLHKAPMKLFMGNKPNT